MKVATPHAAMRARTRSRRRKVYAAAGVAALTGLVAIGLLDQPRNRLLAVTSGASAPTLEIGMKFKDLHPIHEQREAALRTERLRVSDSDFAPATIEIEGRSANVELRLADASPEALAGEKWPLRVHAAKGDHVFGLRELTLRAPSPGGHADALFLEHLERLDVLAARLLFVEARLNGKRLGLMALAELPSTELLERQQRRDGIVVRIETDPVPEVIALEPRRIAKSRKLRANLARATAGIEGLFDHTERADAVFDAEAVGRFLAAAEHWGASAPLAWDQLRFYLNPLTHRLEPVGVPVVGQPAEVGQPREAGSSRSPIEMPFAARVLANPAIAAAFVRSRMAIADAFADGSSWRQATEYERALRRLLHRDDPSLPALDLAALREAPRPAIPKPAPTEIRPDEERVEITPLLHRTVEENLERHAFLEWDAEAGELRTRSGIWSVHGSLILPDRVGLTVPAGTVLRFEPRAGLIARGPLRFEGTPEAPVVLEGPPGTKRSQLWSGVYVVESDRPSHWRHVVVRNTGGFKRAGWSLSGGVVFRKTHADLDHCALRMSRADDALNLVRSTFLLRNVEVRDAASDAIDFDHSHGRVEGGYLSRTGGDGLDLGGSTVEVSGTRIAEIRDKAISVGERSRLVAREIDVERVGIGIASKNASTAELFDSELRKVNIVGLIAYANRAEYGPGRILANGNQFTATTRLALAEAGSQIVVDGIDASPEDVSVSSVDAIAAAE